MVRILATMGLLVLVGCILWVLYCVLQILVILKAFLSGSPIESEYASPDQESIYPKGRLIELLILNKELYRVG